MLWMNAFPVHPLDPVDPVDPLDPLQNSWKLDSMRRRVASAAFARNPGPISIKIEEFLGRKPWEGSGQFLGLP